MASELTTAAVGVPVRAAWRRYFADAVLLARFVFAFAILFGSRHGTHYLHHVVFVIGIAIVTWPVRGMRWSTIYDFFIAGVIGAYVVVAIQWVIEVAILHRSMQAFRASVIAPVTEEPLKLAPVVILLLLLRWRGRWWTGACDVAACGAALGSAFGFVEDSMRRAFGYPSSEGPRVFGIPLMPDSYNGFIGHGGSTALIALALGWWLWASRWKKWRAVAVVPIALTFYWMVLDHGLANYHNYEMDRFSRWIWRLDGNGMRAPYAFAILMIATLAAEWIALAFFAPKVRRAPLSAALRYIRRPFDRGFGYPQWRIAVSRVRGVLLYRLSHRQLRLLMLRARGDVPIDRRRFAEAVTEVSGRLLVGHAAITQP